MEAACMEAACMEATSMETASMVSVSMEAVSTQVASMGMFVIAPHGKSRLRAGSIFVQRCGM